MISMLYFSPWKELPVPVFLLTDSPYGIDLEHDTILRLILDKLQKGLPHNFNPENETQTKIMNGKCQQFWLDL